MQCVLEGKLRPGEVRKLTLVHTTTASGEAGIDSMPSSLSPALPDFKAHTLNHCCMKVVSAQTLASIKASCMVIEGLLEMPFPISGCHYP